MRQGRKLGKWTLLTHTTFGPAHELATPGVDSSLAASIVVSEGSALEGIDQWPWGAPRIAVLREVIEVDGGRVVLEDIGTSTSLVAFPRVFPIGFAWTIGAAIARALADVHDAGHVIGGLAASHVFVDDDCDVMFAPRVLAFRPARERTQTPEADVVALTTLLHERVAPGDRAALEADTRDGPDARTLAERFRARSGASREALGAWLAVDPSSASLAKRVRWVLGVSKASDETVISTFDEIAAGLGASHRIVIEPPEHDNAAFFTDSEIDWEMQRGSRRTMPQATNVREAVSSLIAKLESVDAKALEQACASILPRQLADPRFARCPTCASTRVSFLEAWEITEATCAACGRRDTVDLHELDEWYSR